MVLAFWLALILMFVFFPKNEKSAYSFYYGIVYGLIFTGLSFYTFKTGGHPWYAGAELSLGLLLIFVSVLDKNSEEFNKQIEEEKNNFFEEHNFVLDESVFLCRPKIYETLEFLIDKENQQFAVFQTKNKNLDNRYEICIFKFTDLLDYELSVDSTSKFSMNGLATLGGALFFGLTGAVVGAALGGIKEDLKGKSIFVNLKTDKIETPYISLCLLAPNQFTDNDVYQYAKQRANELITKLEYIKRVNEQNLKKDAR